jgi:membrane protein implicated in regulation of membrane protease activity
MSGMHAWIWFSIAVVLSIAEVLGGEFVLLMLGGGALITALVSLGVGLLWLQLVVFAVASLALVFGLRPQLKRHFIKPAQIRSGIEALIGSKATVISTVDSAGGQVKIGGEVWSAVGVDGHRPLPPGTPVTVVEVRGATAVVIWGP